MANNMMEWFQGVPAAPKKPFSTKPLSFMDWKRNDGLVAPPVTPQFGAFDGKSTFGQNWGKPSQPFNMTGSGWNNPAVTTNAFNGTGVPAGPSIPSVRQFAAPVVPPVQYVQPGYVKDAFAYESANQPAYASLAGFGSQDSWNKTITDMDGFNSQTGVNAPTYATGVTDANLGGGWMDSLKGFMKSAVGDKDNPGWGGLALGTANSLMSGYLGMKQYGLAKDSFAENKNQFALNYGAQRDSTNTELEDRQRARVAANPNAVSVEDYMNKNRIK